MTSRAIFDHALMNDPVHDLQALAENGSWSVFPEVQAILNFGGNGQGHKDLWWHTKLVVAQTMPKNYLRWAALFHDVGKPRCFKRDGNHIEFHGHEELSAKLFKQAAKRTGFFTPEETHDISFVIGHLGYIEAYEDNWTDSAVRRVQKLLGKYFQDSIALSRADVTTGHVILRRSIHERMHNFRVRAEAIAALDAKVPPLVKGLGNILATEFGVTGKELGVLMTKAKEAVEAGILPVQAEASVVVAYLRGLS